MSLTPYLPAYFASNQAFLNQNANFASFPGAVGAVGYPPGWQANTGTGFSKALGSVSPWALLGAGPEAANAIAESMPGANTSGSCWFILDVTAGLIEGALTGAGVVVNFFADAALSTYTESIAMPFATTPDVNGVVQNAGVIGQTYHWRALYQTHNPLSNFGQVYPCAHYSVLGSIATANAIGFSNVGFRAATPAEIAAGNQIQGLPVFPLLPGITPDTEKTPTWSTKVLRASAGNERRTAQWPYPIWEFTLKYEVLRDKPQLLLDEAESILEVFNTVQGQFGCFLFLDEGNFSVVQEAIGTGDGVSTQFQLYRHIRNWLEPVLTPFGVTMYVNGAVTGASIGANGLVTFGSPPGSGAVIAWSGGFFYPCRFGQDDLTLKRIAYQLWSNDGLKFNSVRNLT